MNSTILTVDYWRNYKPVVPELIEVTGLESTSTRIDLTQLLIQGARDEEGNSPTEGILDKVQAQRGWRLAPLIISTPLLGTVKMSDDKMSIIYTPPAKFVGVECFNFRLTNGTQASDPVRVEIDVKRNYRMWFDIYQRNEDVFVFRERHEFPSEIQKPYAYSVVWWLTGPVAVWNEKRQANEIFKQRRVVRHSDIWTHYQQFYPSIRLNNRLEMAFPTDEELRGYDGSSERLYNPTGTRGRLELEGRVYLSTAIATSGLVSWLILDTRKWTQLDVDSGDDWWKSGNILPITAEKR